MPAPRYGAFGRSQRRSLVVSIACPSSKWRRRREPATRLLTRRGSLPCATNRSRDSTKAWTGCWRPCRRTNEDDGHQAHRMTSDNHESVLPTPQPPAAMSAEGAEETYSLLVRWRKRLSRLVGTIYRRAILENLRYQIRVRWPGVRGLEFVALAALLVLLRAHHRVFDAVCWYARRARRRKAPDLAHAEPGNVLHVTGSFDSAARRQNQESLHFHVVAVRSPRRRDFSGAELPLPARCRHRRQSLHGQGAFTARALPSRRRLRNPIVPAPSRYGSFSGTSGTTARASSSGGGMRCR